MPVMTTTSELCRKCVEEQSIIVNSKVAFTFDDDYHNCFYLQSLVAFEVPPSYA